MDDKNSRAYSGNHSGKKMKKFFFLSLASGFGLGYSRIAPGTIGSLPGFFLVWMFSLISPSLQILGIIGLFFVGVWISSQAQQYFEKKDPGTITIDEIVSLPITFFLIPLSPKILILGFILNRILDIFKPWPAYGSQSLKGGWGIMADDMISGIYSNILLHLLLRFIL